MMMIWSHPEARASSTPYWMMGLSTSGSISLGCALVAGRKRVPRPAAGKTAFLTLANILLPVSASGVHLRNRKIFWYFNYIRHAESARRKGERTISKRLRTADAGRFRAGRPVLPTLD